MAILLAGCKSTDTPGGATAKAPELARDVLQHIEAADTAVKAATTATAKLPESPVKSEIATNLGTAGNELKLAGDAGQKSADQAERDRKAAEAAAAKIKDLESADPTWARLKAIGAGLLVLGFIGAAVAGWAQKSSLVVLSLLISLAGLGLLAIGVMLYPILIGLLIVGGIVVTVGGIWAGYKWWQNRAGLFNLSAGVAAAKLPQEKKDIIQLATANTPIVRQVFTDEVKPIIDATAAAGGTP